MKVQVTVDGDTVEVGKQDEVEKAIMMNNDKSFPLTYETPLMDRQFMNK